MRLLIATRNRHKTEEIAAMLGAEFSVTDLNAHPEVPSAVESGDTFLENATIKAVEAARVFGDLVLADDSGLEVDALGGAPGVRSARYAGEKAADHENTALLLSELNRLNVPEDARTARFRCVIVIARAGEALGSFSGAVEGHIVATPRGTNGFGYDPVFVPEGFTETFAELGSETKNQLSHRARAMAQAAVFLSKL